LPRIKVTRNRQVTIPAEIASLAHISEGDILNVELVGERILFQKVRDEIPVMKIGRKISDDEIERLAEAATRELAS